MTDFFISYTSADTIWAEWIAYVLEEEGFEASIQAWDFRPGKNFVLEMQEAARKADRTLMVLSPDYLRSQFASPEWAAAFGQDPQGREMKLLPVMVRDCAPPGLLRSIVQIRIVGMDETAARKALLAGIDKKRAKPSARPAFPGMAAPVEHKAFPGPSANAGRPVANLILPLNRAPTDLERRRFAKGGFETIKALFETNLQAVSQSEPRIETDFRMKTATEFSAEIFLDGKMVCVCRVKMGVPYSENNISYAEGPNIPDGASNEILMPSDAGELDFHAMMHMGIGFLSQGKNYDFKHLSADQAADYLWGRFVSPLHGR